MSECLQVLGGLGYMKDYPYERYLRDARILLIFEVSVPCLTPRLQSHELSLTPILSSPQGTNEILRLFIALTGIQHASKELKEVVSRMKDPFNNVGFILKKSLERYRISKKNPVLPLKLVYEVHPDLGVRPIFHCKWQHPPHTMAIILIFPLSQPVAEEMEVRLIKFQLAVESQLSLYRNDIVNEQMVLKRLADIAIDLYAMTSVLARCSRSLSIGLRSADHEVSGFHTFECHVMP